jgi:hypothetical protein
VASDTYALRQAVWKHEDAVQMHHAGDKPYEHVQAWRDAVVSAAMDMRDAAVARALAAERARVVGIFTEPLNGFPLIPSIALDTALDALAVDASMGAEDEDIDSHKESVRDAVRRIYASHVARVAAAMTDTAAPRGTTTEGG